MYKYSLEKGSKKNECPRCSKKRFVYYIDNEKKEVLHPTVGRCDREVSCGYHFTPKDFFKQNENIKSDPKPIIRLNKKFSFHPKNYVDKSLKETDYFTRYLKKVFVESEFRKIQTEYKIGTSNQWRNATIFWQIDQYNKVRAGKVILYKNTGHRTKYTTWIHSILLKKKLLNTFCLGQCLFGLHLIYKNNKPIAIVESEKTACIMSVKFPKYCWLATGGSNNISDNLFTSIKNRKIILFPDLSSENQIYEKWNKKAQSLKKFGFDISVSNLLEKIGTESDRNKGLDIADYFLRIPSKIKPRIIMNISDGIISNRERIYEKLHARNSELQTLVKIFDLEV